MLSVSTTDWLQAWGTVIGSIFSAVATVAALALLVHEIRHRRAEAAQAVRRQAQGLFITIECPSRPKELTEISLVVKNLSDQAILDLHVMVTRADNGLPVRPLMSSDVFAPNYEWSLPVTLDPPMTCNRPEYPVDLFVFNSWFTDSQGRNWHRMNRDQPVAMALPPRLAADQFS